MKKPIKLLRNHADKTKDTVRIHSKMPSLKKDIFIFRESKNSPQKALNEKIKSIPKTVNVKFLQTKTNKIVKMQLKDSVITLEISNIFSIRNVFKYVSTNRLNFPS